MMIPQAEPAESSWGTITNITASRPDSPPGGGSPVRDRRAWRGFLGGGECWPGLGRAIWTRRPPRFRTDHLDPASGSPKGRQPFPPDLAPQTLRRQDLHLFPVAQDPASQFRAERRPECQFQPAVEQQGERLGRMPAPLKSQLAISTRANATPGSFLSSI